MKSIISAFPNPLAALRDISFKFGNISANFVSSANRIFPFLLASNLLMVWNAPKYTIHLEEMSKFKRLEKLNKFKQIF